MTLAGDGFLSYINIWRYLLLLVWVALFLLDGLSVFHTSSPARPLTFQGSIYILIHASMITPFVIDVM